MSEIVIRTPAGFRHLMNVAPIQGIDAEDGSWTMGKAKFLIAVAGAALLGACGVAPSADAGSTPGMAAEAAAEAQRIAEAQRVAEETARVQRAVQAVIDADARTEVPDNPAATAAAMRAIPLDQTPSDFREAYIAHIQAWENYAQVKRQLARVASDEQRGIALISGVACGLLECPATPIADQIAVENNVEQRVALAGEAIIATFQALEQRAVRYGARVPA